MSGTVFIAAVNGVSQPRITSDETWVSPNGESNDEGRGRVAAVRAADVRLHGDRWFTCCR